MLCLAVCVFVYPCHCIPYNHLQLLPALFRIWTGAVFLAWLQTSSVLGSELHRFLPFLILIVWDWKALYSLELEDNIFSFCSHRNWLTDLHPLGVEDLGKAFKKFSVLLSRNWETFLTGTVFHNFILPCFFQKFLLDFWIQPDILDGAVVVREVALSGNTNCSPLTVEGA